MAGGTPQIGCDVRVLVVTPRFLPEVGGVERHVHQVARRHVAAGHHVTVLCTDRTGSLPPRHVVDGIAVRRVHAWPRRRDLFLAPGLWAAMAEGDWDVVHVQSFHTFVAPTAMLRARILRLPYVLTFHGGGHSSALRRRLRGTQLRLLGPFVRRASRLVATAQFEVPVYSEAFSVDVRKFVVVPNGVDPVPAGVTAVAAPDGAEVIASIGRLERYKGHHRALAAFAHLHRVRPRARLWIVGTGPEEEPLRREAIRLGVADAVTFRSVPIGEQDAMYALMSQTSLILCLSDFETHPMVALEALAAGRPLVVTATSGLDELARRGLARSVPLDSSAAVIAAAVAEALDSPVAPVGIGLPSWDDCADLLLQLYEEVTACAS